MDPAKLKELTDFPMGAVVSLGGCTASFVSPQGLAVTNHHCAYGSIQYNSKPDRDLLKNGFYAATLDRGEPMAEPGVAGDYFHRKLRGHASETFAAMFLDGRLRMIGFEELFTGTVDKAEIYPREVCRRALACNASAVIVGHNHPSGTPDPSNADREATLELRRVLKCIDVRLLDHIIVGDGPPVSLAARGLL